MDKNTDKTPARNALSLLKQDHRKVKELLAELEQTTGRGVKRRSELLEEIALEVRTHAHVEETLFYPAFRKAGENKEDEKLFLEAAEEHRLVHEMLPQIEQTDPASELFSARAKVLKDLIEHHAEEEEKELFPRAKELMSKDELADLGRRIEEQKQRIEDRGLPPDARRRAPAASRH